MPNHTRPPTWQEISLAHQRERLLLRGLREVEDAAWFVERDRDAMSRAAVEPLHHRNCIGIRFKTR